MNHADRIARRSVLALCFCLVVACGDQPRSDAERTAGQEGALASSAVLEVTAIDGGRHRPLAPPDGRPTVLLFLSADCPIANAYAPEITSIRRDFADGAHFLLVHVDCALTREAAARHSTDYGLSGPIVIDREHRLVRAAGASITPEAAVLHRGEIVYRGRIDNWFAALGRRRPRATEHDLRDALAAVIAGRAVPTPRTEAVGCFIPDLPK